jgi:hypothetical protein
MVFICCNGKIYDISCTQASRQLDIWEAVGKASYIIILSLWNIHILKQMQALVGLYISKTLPNN